MTVCIDTNVLLGFFNNEPDKVESCTTFFQLLFTKRIKSIVSTAIETRCSYLITFDTDFKSVGEIQVLTPQKFLELQN